MQDWIIRGDRQHYDCRFEEYRHRKRLCLRRKHKRNHHIFRDGGSVRACCKRYAPSMQLLCSLCTPVLPFSFQLSSHVKSMSINVICAGNVQLTGSSTGLGKVIYNQGVCNVGVQPGFLSLAICCLCKLCLRLTSSSSTW